MRRLNKLEKATDQRANPSPLLNDANLNILYPFGLGLTVENTRWISGEDKTMNTPSGLMIGEVDGDYLDGGKLKPMLLNGLMRRRLGN